MIEYKNIRIYKFEVVDGINSLPDSFFIELFNKIIGEGAINTFYQLSRKEDLNPYQFMNWCKSNHFYLLSKQKFCF